MHRTVHRNQTGYASVNRRTELSPRCDDPLSMIQNTVRASL